VKALSYFPFNKLVVPPGESALWCGSNPTFHRASEYGIVLTDQALYLYYSFWARLARWRRYSLAEIAHVHFRDSKWFPKLLIDLGHRTVAFRTPYDSYEDEMAFDRRVLVQTACFVEYRRGLCRGDGAAPNNSFKPKPLRGSA
jgi:hypothetical protein